MNKKPLISMIVTLAVSVVLIFPVLPLTGNGPDAVSAATTNGTTSPSSTPKPTAVTAPVSDPVTAPTVPTQTVYSNTPSTWSMDALALAESVGLTVDSIMGQYNKPITRLEYTKLIVSLYETVTGKVISPSVSMPFSDTSSLDVAKAKAAGLVSGVGNSKFNPNGTLTRQEAAVILFRESTATNTQFQMPSFNYRFNDESQIAWWAKDALQYLYHNGLISGIGNGKIDPTGTATREQSIVLVANAYQNTSTATVDVVSSATLKSPPLTTTDAVSSATGKSSSTSGFDGDGDDDGDDEEEGYDD